jgi:hypothetical protein
MVKRQYGLFFKATVKGRTRWVRLYPKLAFPKATAIRIFQNRLLDLSFRGKCPELRPV